MPAEVLPRGLRGETEERIAIAPHGENPLRDAVESNVEARSGTTTWIALGLGRFEVELKRGRRFIGPLSEDEAFELEELRKHADKDRKGKHHVRHLGEQHIQWALRLDGE